MNREDLIKSKKDLEKKLYEINDLLSRDKDEIKDFLFQINDDNLKTVIADKIIRIRKYYGETDEIKNQMSYTGIVFETKEHRIFKIVHGVNWCSSILDLLHIEDFDDDYSWDCGENIRSDLSEIRENDEWEPVMWEIIKSQYFCDYDLCLIIAAACLDY